MSLAYDDVASDDGDECPWKTDLIEFEGKMFFIRVFKKNGYFTVDVAMKGSLEECRGFVIEAALLDANSDLIEPAIEARFPPRPLKEDNKPGFCLTVPSNLMSEVWKRNGVDDEFDIEFELEFKVVIRE